MNTRSGKWWLAAVLCCLAPAAFAVVPVGCPGSTAKNCQQVPEGGSTAVYLIAAGITCLGAMFLRSKAAKATP